MKTSARVVVLRNTQCFLLLIIYWFVFLQLIMINREEKSLRHVAMVAKFLDNHKPKTSLESEFAQLQTF